MALPKLLQKLFQNDGVGPLLRSDILPIKTVDGYAPDAIGNVDTQRLPLSGGTMTGELKLTDGLAIVGTNNSSSHTFMSGSSYAGGAYFQAFGNERGEEAGWFYVVARGANGYKALNGRPDGTLAWGDKHIVRTVNGVAADTSGNVDYFPTPNYSAGVTRSKATDYTAESDGYIMIDCYHNYVSGTAHIYVTINGTGIPFKPAFTNYGSATMYLPIKRGDTYKLSSDSSSFVAYFFPAR